MTERHPEKTPGPYADLRKLLTRLGEARRRWEKALAAAGPLAAARNYEAFEALRREAKEAADRVLAPEP